MCYPFIQSSLHILQIRKHLPFAFFLGVFFILGIYIYRDYGFPWDEIFQLDLVHRTYNYINQWDTSLLSYQFRYLGTGSELILLAFCRFFPTLREVYARHLGVFLFFLSGLIPIYLIGLRLFKNEFWALLSVICLSLSPRIFGDAFYNSKDIPFMISFAYAIFFLYKFADYSSSPLGGRLAISLIHSFFTALCISTRIAGIIILVISITMITFGLISDIKRYKEHFIVLSTFLFFTVCFTIFFTPASWANPIQHFIQTIMLYSNVPSELTMLYNGQFIQASSTPWHYFPVWIGITTPIMITTGFILSQTVTGFICLRSMCSSKKNSFLQRAKTLERKANWLIIGLWLYLPVAALFILRSTISDGWRQMFFVYPPMVIFAVGGFRYLIHWIKKNFVRYKIINILVAFLIIAGLIEPLIFMIQYHPHQNIYFSPLVGNYSTIRYRYEMDYWGLSYKQGIDQILAIDSSEQIHIYIPQPSGGYYVQYMLDPNQKSRIVFVNDPSKADYFITEYRFHPQDYPYDNKIFVINIRGMEILAIYKIPG